MSDISRLLAETRKERGYTETPSGSNCNKFAGEAHLKNCTYWCGAYTSALLIRTKADVPPGALTLSTRANLAAWKKAGRFVGPTQVQPGDVVFYHLTGRNGSDHNVPDHTGFCIEAPSNGRLIASEGNTSNSEHGSQDNGGGVYDRTRGLGIVIGAGRPVYGTTPTPPSEDEDMLRVISCRDHPGALFLTNGIDSVRTLSEAALVHGRNLGMYPKDVLSVPHDWIAWVDQNQDGHNNPDTP